jgi:hypothetical protein
MSPQRRFVTIAGITLDRKNPCHYVGEKYAETKDLDIKDIAKLVRADIRKAVEEERLPDGSYSVRIDKFNFGQSLHVDLTLPGMMPKNSSGIQIKLKERIREIMSIYNFDAGDPQIDYSCSRFFELPQIHWEIYPKR